MFGSWIIKLFLCHGYLKLEEFWDVDLNYCSPGFPSWHILSLQSAGPGLSVLISEGSRVRSRCVQPQAQGAWGHCWSVQQEHRDKTHLELPWMTVLGGTGVLARAGTGLCWEMWWLQQRNFKGTREFILGLEQRNMDISSGPCELLGRQQHEQYSLDMLGKSSKGKWDKPWKYLYPL